MLYSLRATVSALFRSAPRRCAAKRAAAFSVVGLPLAASVVASLAIASSACVDVPDSVHAQFAAARPDERSNFRKGAHGLARPEPSSVASSAPVAPSSAPNATDAGACTTGTPCPEKPSEKSADAKAPSAPDASTTTTTSAALDGGSP